MAGNTYILNRSQSHDSLSVGGGQAIKLQGFKEMQKTLDKMTKDDLKALIRIVRKESKPMIQEMRKNAPRSSKRATVTKHRHFSKGQFTTIDRKHKPGELKRSIGTVRSRKFRKMPVMYVGPRKGPNVANDGWYAFLVEFGTKKMDANPFIAKSINSKGRTVVNNMIGQFKKHFGHKWEGKTA